MNRSDSSFIISKVFKINFSAMLMGSFVAMSGILVDSVMISRFLGERSLTSYGVVMSVFLAVSALASLLSAGGQVLAGQDLGIGNIDEANRTITLVHIWSWVLIAILIIVSLVFQEPILAGLGMTSDDGDLYLMCKEYMIGLIIGYPGIVWSTVMSQFLPIDSDTKRSFLSTIIMTVVNITGDFLNVFLFHGGMFGMALATSVSYYVSFLVVLPHYLNPRYSLKLYVPGADIKKLPALLKSGLPTAINRGMTAFRNIGLNRILLLISTTSAVGALTVGRSLANFYNPLLIALGMVVLMMGSAFLKEKDSHTLFDLLKTMVKYCYGPIMICMVLLLVFSKPLTGMFIDRSSDIFASSHLCVICMVIALPFNCFNLGMTNYLQSIGKTTASLIYSIVENGAVLLIMAFILGNLIGDTGVWISFPLTEVIILISFLIYSWIFNRHIPHSIKDLLFLDERYGVPESDQLNTSICTMEQVTGFSEEVRQFCLKKNMDRKTSNLMALCVEEMAGNIIRWGFDDGKPHSIDLRLIYTEGKTSLRIRDDCKPFDPRKQAEIYQSQTDVQNIGIRMISALTKDIRYVYMMKMNVLFLEV
ncbi:MAG: ATP-binding protein [Lachnospiraceae bacterium]|nr:ATP-binding protein [Lachnospiraceae bacterium]